MPTDQNRPTPEIPFKALAVFVLLTFGITWGLVGPYILYPDWASARFGDISGSHPFFFLATWAPAISAFTLVIFYGGLRGFRSFVSRLLLWRIPLPWVLVTLIALPLVFVLGSILKGGPMLAPLPPDGAGQVIAVMFMMLFLGPIEEFGWRGVAQPLMQRRMAPIWAGAIIGAIWGIWHLPAFYLSGLVFAEWSFLPFFVGNVTIAILVTPLFNASRGSLFWPMLFHWQLINPLWPDAQPYDTWILVVVTGIVVWWKRHQMFSRDVAIVDVLPRQSSSSA